MFVQINVQVAVQVVVQVAVQVVRWDLSKCAVVYVLLRCRSMS